MGKSNIKGITVEIGGNTTKLDKALDGAKQKGISLSSELGSINKLLKFDPGNVDLLSQKQKVLADAISNTREKLDTLKRAEAQVQEQFERGEVSEDQVRALQREIIETTNKVKQYEKALSQTSEDLEKFGNESSDVKGNLKDTKKESDKASDALDDLADSADNAGDSADGMGAKLGGAVKGGIMALGTAVVGLGGALVGSAEASREYRADMGKLTTAFETSGHSAESATETYQALQGILGESDQAVEASNHLAKLVQNEEDLAKWTDIATGVYATFGDSLPIENLTEASNETAKTGQITGGLADALNWAGESETAFQEKLDACSTEQERQALITETLNGLYAESAEKYRETNAEVIRANEANEALTASMADIGASIEPVLTDFKMLGASLLSDLVPGIKSVSEAFRGVLNGESGSGEALGSALSGIITQLLTKLTELGPTLATVAISLITTLITTLISSLPQLMSTAITMGMALLNGLVSAIPQIVNAIVTMIPQLTSALVTGIPQLIQGAVNLFLALVQAIPLIIPPLIQALPSIIMAIINGLLTAIPQLIQGALQLLMAIVQAIPLLIQTLVPMIPSIVTSVITALLDCLPMLLNGAVDLFTALIEAFIQIQKELLKATPKMITAVVNILKQLPGKIFNAISGAIGKIATWGNNMKSKASSVVSNMVSTVVSKAKEIPGKIYDAIKSAVDKVATWGNNMKNKAVSAIKNVATAIKDGLKSVPESMSSVGKNIVEGLWKGISNATSWIKEKVGGFAKSILKGMKDALGIKSPSRVFRDEVGKYIAEGIGVGITNNEDKPIGALGKLTKDMLNSTSDINGVTLNRQLNTTFAGQTRPEGSVADLVELVSEYMPKLVEASKKSILLDGKTLVGETIGEIDARLSKNYTLRARGV